MFDASLNSAELGGKKSSNMKNKRMYRLLRSIKKLKSQFQMLNVTEDLYTLVKLTSAMHTEQK